MKRLKFQRGFVLLEAMIAVAVFSIGVLALGRCVEQCITAEMIKEEDERARRFLASRMAEIEQGSVVVTDKATEERMLSRTPLGRFGDPSEVAGIAVFLASDDASYLTGQTIYPDGGRLGLNYTVPVLR